MSGIGRLAATTAQEAAHDTKLRRTAQQLEGVFVEQLFKAMRATVPEDGIAGGGFGEEVFTGLMDQHVAESAALQWDRGLGAALYRQLRDRTTTASPVPLSTESGE